jgi:hypothetical protein
VSGIFRAGQLVTPEDWVDPALELYNEPDVLAASWSTLAYVLGTLEPGDVAMVIAVPKRDGSSVYVLGPNGGGWTFGAMLKVVEDV